MSENDVECLASKGVNAPVTIFSTVRFVISVRAVSRGASDNDTVANSGFPHMTERIRRTDKKVLDKY